VTISPRACARLWIQVAEIGRTGSRRSTHYGNSKEAEAGTNFHLGVDQLTRLLTVVDQDATTRR
jgi:hypothetical protein